VDKNPASVLIGDELEFHFNGDHDVILSLVYILSNLGHGFRNDSFSDCPAICPTTLDFQLTRRSFGATGTIDATRAGPPFGYAVVKFIVPVSESCRLFSS
jgi:hypothetical protein